MDAIALGVRRKGRILNPVYWKRECIWTSNHQPTTCFLFALPFTIHVNQSSGVCQWSEYDAKR